MMKLLVLVVSLLPSLVSAYVHGLQPRPPRSTFGIERRATTPVLTRDAQVSQRRTTTTGTRLLSSDTSASASAAAVPSVTEQLRSLLENFSGETLLQSSSDSWRSAIYDAVGAPASADSAMVAKTLQDSMSRPDSQFAILTRNAEAFVANFPSDPVDFLEDGTCWVECRLREKQTDELLVTMSIQLMQQDNGNWVISSLDWQDFRDAFYPGLSGREWLRAF